MSADGRQTELENGSTLVADILHAVNKGRGDIDETKLSASMQNLSSMIKRIDAGIGCLSISVDLTSLLKPDASRDPIITAFEVPFQKHQNGRARPIIIASKDAPQQDIDIIALIADARRWARELLEGKASSIQQVTEREGLRSGSVSRILPLAWLAPDISTAILEGRQPSHLSAKALRDLPELPLDWVMQREILGFPHH